MKRAGWCSVCGKKEAMACYLCLHSGIVRQFHCRECYLWAYAIEEERKWKRKSSTTCA